MKPKDRSVIAEPAKCTRMSEEETEYDGGWFWSAAVAAVGIGMTVIGYATKNKKLQAAGDVITIIGIVSSGIGMGVAVSRLATSTATAVMDTAGKDLAVEASLGAISNTTGFCSMLGGCRNRK